MFKTNTLKSKINQCAFSYGPLFDIYKIICSLEIPYLWVTFCGSAKALYYINDIETFEGVLSGIDNTSGWELPSRCDDIIRLHITRIKNDKTCNSYFDISLPSMDKEYTCPIDKLMYKMGICIPTIEELEKTDFEDGIPGHITTDKEKNIKLQSTIKECEKEITLLSMENKIYKDMIYRFNCDIRHNDSRMRMMQRDLDKALLEISKLNLDE